MKNIKVIGEDIYYNDQIVAVIKSPNSGLATDFSNALFNAIDSDIFKEKLEQLRRHNGMVELPEINDTINELL